MSGVWRGETEGATCWLSICTARHQGEVEDGFLACAAGLQGLPDAIEAVLPKTQVQRCIVPNVRQSLKFVPWKARKAVAADLRAIDGAATLAEAKQPRV